MTLSYICYIGRGTAIISRGDGARRNMTCGDLAVLSYDWWPTVFTGDRDVFFFLVLHILSSSWTFREVCIVSQETACHKKKS